MRRSYEQRLSRKCIALTLTSIVLIRTIFSEVIAQIIADNATESCKILFRSVQLIDHRRCFLRDFELNARS